MNASFFVDVYPLAQSCIRFIGWRIYLFIYICICLFLDLITHHKWSKWELATGKRLFYPGDISVNFISSSLTKFKTFSRLVCRPCSHLFSIVNFISIYSLISVVSHHCLCAKILKEKVFFVVWFSRTIYLLCGYLTTRWQ